MLVNDKTSTLKATPHPSFTACYPGITVLCAPYPMCINQRPPGGELVLAVFCDYGMYGYMFQLSSYLEMSLNTDTVIFFFSFLQLPCTTTCGTNSKLKWVRESGKKYQN